MNAHDAPVVYRIRDWDRHFESSHSRKVKDLDWVRVPTGQGRGYQAIMRRADALEVMGAWLLIVELAASMPVRGTLTERDGSGMSAQAIADAVRCRDVATIERVLDLLCDPKIGWMEAVSQCESTSSTSVELDSTLMERNSTFMESDSTEVIKKVAQIREEKSRGEERRLDGDDPFSEFMNAFAALGQGSSEEDRMQACRDWISLPDSEQSKALGWIRQQSRPGGSFYGKDAQYIPRPETCIRNRRWNRPLAVRTGEDALSIAVRRMSGGGNG